jgi:hypothetical protein
VLATLFFIPWGYFLIVKRNGGANKWQKILADHIESRGDSLFFYWLKFSVFIIPLIHAMLWLVDYPLSSAEYLLWVSKTGIPVSAFFYTYTISLYLGISYTVWKLFLNNLGRT